MEIIKKKIRDLKSIRILFVFDFFILAALCLGFNPNLFFAGYVYFFAVAIALYLASTDIIFCTQRCNFVRGKRYNNTNKK